MISRVVISALFVLLSIAAAPQSAVAQSAWTKRFEKVISDGGVPATWSHIYADSPYSSRRLYQDHEGALLVIRDHRDAVDPNSSTVSIESLGTEETLSFLFDHAGKSVTVTLGGSQIVIDFESVEGEMGVDGTEFPEPIEVAAIALLGSATQGFQDALRRLAIVGCYETADYYLLAVLYAHLFYDDIDCTDGPSEKRTVTLETVPSFDPSSTPPSAFEQQFGAAYYQ